VNNLVVKLEKLVSGRFAFPAPSPKGFSIARPDTHIPRSTHVRLGHPAQKLAYWPTSTSSPSFGEYLLLFALYKRAAWAATCPQPCSAAGEIPPPHHHPCCHPTSLGWEGSGDLLEPKRASKTFWAKV